MNVSDMNLRVLQIMSMALSGWARQIDAADVQTLARECGVERRGGQGKNRAVFQAVD